MNTLRFGQMYIISPYNWGKKDQTVSVQKMGETIRVVDPGRKGQGLLYDAYLPGFEESQLTRLFHNPKSWGSNPKPSTEGPDYLLTGKELKAYDELSQRARADYDQHASRWSGKGLNTALAELGGTQLHKTVIDLIEQLKDMTDKDAAAEAFSIGLNEYYETGLMQVLGENPKMVAPNSPEAGQPGTVVGHDGDSPI